MDLQKIAQEAVKAATQAQGTVNFNFNDIHHNQNVYLGADGKIGTSTVDPNEPLSYYITDAELLGRIIDIAEKQCTKPQHVKTLIFDELIRAGMRRDILLSKPFIEALIPHLPQLVCPNVENLNKAFRREV